MEPEACHTGFFGYLGKGRDNRTGQQPPLFGITKENWGEVHFWICVAVVVVTIIHIIIDWKALRGVIRYLTSVHRERIKRI